MQSKKPQHDWTNLLTGICNALKNASAYKVDNDRRMAVIKQEWRDLTPAVKAELKENLERQAVAGEVDPQEFIPLMSDLDMDQIARLIAKIETISPANDDADEKVAIILRTVPSVILAFVVSFYRNFPKYFSSSDVIAIRSQLESRRFPR